MVPTTTFPMPKSVYGNFAYQGFRACMVSANPFIDLLQNIFDFFFVGALQVGNGEASLVQGVVYDCEPGCSLLDLPGLLDVLW